MALCPGLPRWACTRKAKPIWILLKQETVSGSGISWAICKSALHSRQIAMPAPHHSVFTGRVPFLPPNQWRQSTEGKLLICPVEHKLISQCHLCCHQSTTSSHVWYQSGWHYVVRCFRYRSSSRCTKVSVRWLRCRLPACSLEDYSGSVTSLFMIRTLLCRWWPPLQCSSLLRYGWLFTSGIICCSSCIWFSTLGTVGHVLTVLQNQGTPWSHC